MTIFYAILMVIMLVFAGLQLNDADGLRWTAIYLVPAIALAFAAFAPHRIASLAGRILLFLAVIIMTSAVLVYFPSNANFWNAPKWWDAEPVREGLGTAIAYLFTCATVPLAFRRSVRRFKSKKAKIRKERQVEQTNQRLAEEV